MFSRLSRLPLRRCMHTSSGAARATSSLSRPAKIALGVTAVAGSYISWQLAQEKNRLHMDSPRSAASTGNHSTPAKPTPQKDVPSEPKSAAAEADVFVPDAPSVPDAGSDTKANTPSADAEGEAPSGEGQAASGAFNPETGEINWDCPCLGGMAHGPCGPEFREAFSCFVFSEAEPKGINCVDKFQNMQNCFRAHPEVYADEIMDDDEEEAPSPGTDASSDVPPSERPAEPTFSGDVPSAGTSEPDSVPVSTSS